MFQHSKIQHKMQQNASKCNISRLLDQVSEAKKVEEVLPCSSVQLWVIDAQESVSSSPTLSGIAHKKLVCSSSFSKCLFELITFEVQVNCRQVSEL